MKKKMLKAAALFLTTTLLTPGMTVMAAGESGPSELIEEVKEQIGEAFENLDEETAKELFAFAKEKIADGTLDSNEGIENAIAEGEEKFDITVNEEDVKQIVEVMDKLEDLGFDSEKIVDKAEEVYDQYGSDFAEHTDEVVTDAVTNAVGNAFTRFCKSVGNAIKDFFVNLF